MNIVRIVYDWPPPWSGLSPAPLGLTRAQSKLGHNIAVFCGRWPKAGPIEHVNGVKIFGFIREPLRGFMLLTTAPLMTICFIAWRLFNKVDIYHVHGQFGLYFYIYKLLFGFLDKTPVISHFHISFKARTELMAKEGKKISFVAKYIDWPLSELAERLAIKLASSYVVVSSNVSEELKRSYGVDNSKINVVESGVDVEIFKDVSNEEKKKSKIKLGFKENDLVISNTSYLVERKNIHLLVEALSFLPEKFKLLLIKEGNKAYIEKINKIIEINKLHNRIVFVKPVEHPKIPEYLHASDYFVLPSSYEGFPKVVLEALSCGVAVLGSGFNFKEEIVGYYDLVEKTPEGIATQLENLELNKVSVEVDKVRKLFSWESRASKIDEIYKDCLKG